jgi:hypothetical protein
MHDLGADKAVEQAIGGEAIGHLTAGLGEGQIAEFIEDGEVEPGEVIGESSLAAARASLSSRLTRSTTV